MGNFCKVPDIPVENVSMCVDKVVVVLESEVLEDLVHGLGHVAVELRALDRLVRADLLMVTTILKGKEVFRTARNARKKLAKISPQLVKNYFT